MDNLETITLKNKDGSRTILYYDFEKYKKEMLWINWMEYLRIKYWSNIPNPLPPEDEFEAWKQK